MVEHVPEENEMGKCKTPVTNRSKRKEKLKNTQQNRADLLPPLKIVT